MTLGKGPERKGRATHIRKSVSDKMKTKEESPKKEKQLVQLRSSKLSVARAKWKTGKRAEDEAAQVGRGQLVDLRKEFYGMHLPLPCAVLIFCSP